MKPLTLFSLLVLAACGAPLPSDAGFADESAAVSPSGGIHVPDGGLHINKPPDPGYYLCDAGAGAGHIGHGIRLLDGGLGCE